VIEEAQERLFDIDCESISLFSLTASLWAIISWPFLGDDSIQPVIIIINAKKAMFFSHCYLPSSANTFSG
jgi:hypothetical protein